MVVKEPGGKYSPDLLKACEDHFSRIYPDYVNAIDHETVMCPPAFPFEYIAPTGEASGAIPLSEIEKVNIDGDSAELELFYVLEKFGNETNQPMFVVPKVKVAKFITNVIRQKVPLDRQAYLGKVNFKDAEIDFAIVHHHIGVILIEVKSTRKFSKSLQGKARKQLQISEQIIRALLHVDHSEEISIPVYKVIAMPNVSEPGRGNQQCISLRGIDILSKSSFTSWWQSNFVSMEFVSDEKQQLQKLIAIFVGQNCNVSSKTLSDVHEKIDKQSFLRKSHEKYAKQGGDGPELVVKSADQPGQNILTAKFLFLNLEQLRIWNGPRKQFFNGSSGCGKTILLQFKALECAKKKKEKVIIVAPSSLTNLYREFFEDNMDDNISSRVTVCSPPEFSELLQRRDLEGDLVSNTKRDSGSDFSTSTGRNSPSDAQNGSVGDLAEFHFFVDEMQTFEAEIPDTIKLLEKLLAQITNRDCYCWVAYDYMQRNEAVVSQDVTGGLSSAAEIQNKARELCKKFNVFHPPCLKTVLRSTFEVYNFVQAFAKKSLLGLSQRLNQPQFDRFEQKTKELFVSFAERYDVSNYLGHHVCGPSVSVFENSDFNFIANVIEDEVKRWTESDFLHQVAVLFTSSFPREDLSRLMTQKGIPVCDVNNSNRNAVVLDFGHNAHSYEWRVVVAISWLNDELASNYLMFTRAVSRLLVITTDEKMFPHNHLGKLPD